MDGLCQDCTTYETLGQTGLISAAKRGHLKCVKVLIQSGANVNKQLPDGRTALIFAAAAAGDHSKCIETLINAGAKVNKQTNEVRNALMYAAQHGNGKCVDVLLHAGTYVNKQDGCGNTALMWAARYGHAECVDAFLQTWVDVKLNKQNNNGETALLYAARFGHHECVNLLIKAWADLNKKDGCGWTALMYAVRWGHDKCVDLLLQAGAHVNQTWNYYLNEQQSQEVIKLLYAAGETIDETKFQVPDYLKPPEFSLKHLCRETIRKHLLDIDPHQNLFVRIPQFGLPSLISEYLLYNVSLDDT